MANAIEWTSNQRAFKDSKVAQNVFRLTFICERRRREFKLKNWKILLSPNLEKPGQFQELPQPSGFQPIVIILRPEPDVLSFPWIKEVSGLYERPPTEVDFRSSKRCHKKGFELHSQLVMIGVVTNLKSVLVTIKIWVRNRWTSFYRLVLYLQHIAALYFTQSCRIA